MEDNNIEFSADSDANKSLFLYRKEVIPVASHCSSVLETINIFIGVLSEVRSSTNSYNTFQECLLFIFCFFVFMGIFSLCSKDSVFWIVRSSGCILFMFALIIRTYFYHKNTIDWDDSLNQFVVEDCFQNEVFQYLEIIQHKFGRSLKELSFLCVLCQIALMFFFIGVLINQYVKYKKMKIKHRVRTKFKIRDDPNTSSYGSYSEISYEEESLDFGQEGYTGSIDNSVFGRTRKSSDLRMMGLSSSHKSSSHKKSRKSKGRRVSFMREPLMFKSASNLDRDKNSSIVDPQPIDDFLEEDSD